MTLSATRQPIWGAFTCADCGVGGERRSAAQARCGPCGIAYRRATSRERCRAWSRANADHVKSSREKRYRDNPAPAKSRVAAWVAANPGRAKANAAKTYERHKDRIKAKASAWNAENGERRKQIASESAKRRRRRDPGKFSAEKKARREDPGVRLHDAVSAAVRISLRGAKAGNKWERLVGYSIDALRLHLERQFQPGMSWDNYGSWHVDHVLPVSGFQFGGPNDPEFRACWAITNLQPLWAPDNLRKSAKRLHLL